MTWGTGGLPESRADLEEIGFEEGFFRPCRRGRFHAVRRPWLRPPTALRFRSRREGSPSEKFIERWPTQGLFTTTRQLGPPAGRARKVDSFPAARIAEMSSGIGDPEFPTACPCDQGAARFGLGANGQTGGRAQPGASYGLRFLLGPRPCAGAIGQGARGG